MKNFENPYNRITNKGTVSQTWPGFSEFLLTKKFTKIIQQMSFLDSYNSLSRCSLYQFLIVAPPFKHLIISS